MRHQIIVIILASLSVIYFQSCNNDANNAKDTTLPEHKKQTSVVQDIPLNKQDSSYKNLKKDIENKLGIGSIEDGFDSLQIRIWTIGYKSFDENLIMISNTKGIWSAKILLINFKYDKSNTLVAIDKQITNNEPKSSWNTFVDSLIKYDILTLPDYTTLPNYSVMADSKGTTVEIATKDRYRIYSYPDVDLHISKSPEAYKIHQILKFLSKEVM